MTRIKYVLLFLLICLMGCGIGIEKDTTVFPEGVEREVAFMFRDMYGYKYTVDVFTVKVDGVEYLIARSSKGITMVPKLKP